MTTMMTRALPSSAAAPLHLAADSPGGLPAGLTNVDAARIAAAISAARAESTRLLYAHAWGQWERWCAARTIPALPGDPLALCAYLTARAAEGQAMGTLDLARVAIRHVHRLCGAADPVAAEAVRQVRLGLRRTHGGAPCRLAHPLTLEEIRRILAGIDRATPIGARDAAIILDTATPPPCDAPRSSRSRWPTSSTSQPDCCSTSADPRWIKRGTASWSPWPTANMQPPTPSRPSTPGARSAARHPARSLPGSGATPSASNHSPDTCPDTCPHEGSAREPRPPGSTAPASPPTPCAGHATTAALAGVPLDRIAAQTRHADISVLVNRYIRPLEALATTSSKDLDL